MKNILLSILMCVFYHCFTTLTAETSVPAGNVSGTWTIAGSPYLVQGTVNVPNGETLIIEPGVNVTFQGHYKLNVNGCLRAIGTPADSITFTPADTTTGFWGIRFTNTAATNDSSKIQYCVISYGNTTSVTTPPEDTRGGGIYMQGTSKVLISNNHILRCRTLSTASGGGIFCIDNSSPIIRENLIEYNTAGFGGGIYAKNHSNACITSNTIRYNHALSDGGGFYSSITGVSCNLIGNTIFSNHADRYGGGISVSNACPIILNNYICNNFSENMGGGIYAYGIAWIEPDIYIAGNVIANNTGTGTGAGIRSIVSSADVIPKIYNNTICNNLLLGEATPQGAGIAINQSNAYIKNNILWGNMPIIAKQLFSAAQAMPHLANNDIEGGLSGLGNIDTLNVENYIDNIDADPLFILPSTDAGTQFNGLSANWSILMNSPCVNTGIQDTTGLMLPMFDIDGAPRIVNQWIDMGAYEMQTVPVTEVTYHTSGISITDVHVFPNPVNPDTAISFVLKENSRVHISVFNIRGQLVKELYNNYLSSGPYQLPWQAKELSSGVYFCQINAVGQSITRKVVLVK